MPRQIVPLDPGELTVHDVTVPERDEFLRRLLEYQSTDRHMVTRLYPALADELAGRTLHPLGIINGLLLVGRTFADSIMPGPLGADLRRIVVITMPYLVQALFDDETTCHELQCLLMWACSAPL